MSIAYCPTHGIRHDTDYEVECPACESTPVDIDIRTNYWAKPIPDRRFDWSAIDYATYDGLDGPIGFGATEAEAIADLKEKLEV